MNTLTATQSETKSPLWLKLIAAIGVIWYAFGLLQFWLGYSMDTAAAVASGAITAAHAAAIDGTPMLVWVAFALASGTGLIGAALLFGRSSGAVKAFAISLLSLAIYYGWIYLISGTAGDRPADETIISIVVCVVTFAFFLLSRRVVRNT